MVGKGLRFLFPVALGLLVASQWKRILAAAKRYGVEVSASSWRDLAKGGKDRKH